MRLSKQLAWVGTALAILGCTGDGRTPTQPSFDSPDSPSFVINDGAHGGGTPGFYFLPPLSNITHFTGTPDRTLAPRAEICELAGASCSATIVASFITGPGPNDIHETFGAYAGVWRATSGLDPTKFYRLSVYAGTVRLGYVDIDVVANIRDLRIVDYSRYDALVRGLPFPIVFRIERGIAGAVTVSPPTATIATGGTRQFTATVTDLHGNALSSASVSWSSSNDAVATVEATGLATGVSAGTVAITATSGSASGAASLTVTPPNHPPVANVDSYTAVEGIALNVTAPGVLGNDTDPDGNPITAVLVSGPTHGSFTFNADGSFSYTGNAGYSGSDSFTYQASDGSLTSAPATVTITIAAANHPPVANPDSYGATEDQSLTVAAPGVLSNDTDPDGNTVTAVPATITTAHGTVTLHADGSFVYAPAANYHGGDSFTYEATDGTLISASATVALTVASVNDAPVANADSFTAQEDLLFTGAAPGVLVNDTDVDGDALTAVPGTITTAQGGTVTVNADGSFTYQGAANFHGTDTFAYQVTDGAATSSATVTMTVASVNDAPVANADSYQAIGNVTIHIPAPGLLANDTDVDGDPLAAVPGTVVTANGGTVTINADGSFHYLSASGFTGSDTFTYEANDGTSHSGPATVTITSASRVWYVRNTAAAPGDGRDASPFATLQGVQAASAAGEAIYVMYGNASPLDEGIVLKASQALIGQGIPASITTTLNGQTITLLASGSTPSITDGNASTAIALATNNTVRGVDVGAQSGAGITGSSFGTLSLDHVSSTATGGAAISLQNGAMAASFGTLSSTNSPVGGIELVNLSGTLSATGGSVSGSAVAGVNVSAGTPSFTYPGTISNSAGRTVTIRNLAGGSIVLGGDITGGGTGIEIRDNGGASVELSGASVSLSTGAVAGVTLTNNASSAISFTGGGLSITTTSGSGFIASSGGTLSVIGAGNTILSAGGTALSVQNATIAAAGLTFRSISANGGNNGIVLVNTGSAGGLTVTGTGLSASGGTIQNLTGADGGTAGIGVFLSSTRNVSLGGMALHDFSNFAVRGASVAGFTMDATIVSGTNGTNAGQHEGSLYFTELSGAASITHSAVSGGYQNNLRVENLSASLDRLTIGSSTFGGNDATNGGDGVVLVAGGAATLNVTADNSGFSSARQLLFSVDVQGAAHSDVVLSGNAFSNNHPSIVSGSGGVAVAASGTTSGVTYSVTSNTFRDASGNGFTVAKGSGTPVVSGTIANNQIGVATVSNSGSAQGSALSLTSVGGGTHTVAVTNNRLFQYNNRGILLQIGDATQGGNGVLHATVTGNTISNPGTTAIAKNGVLFNVGTQSGPPIDAHQACLMLSGNGLAGSGSGGAGGTEVRFNERFQTSVRLPGYAGLNNDNAAVGAFIQANNAGTPTFLVGNNVAAGGGGYVGGAACATP